MVHNSLLSLKASVIRRHYFEVITQYFRNFTDVSFIPQHIKSTVHYKTIENLCFLYIIQPFKREKPTST